METLIRTACTDLTRQWKATNMEFKDHVRMEYMRITTDDTSLD